MRCKFCGRNGATEPISDEEGNEFLICGQCNEEGFPNKKEIGSMNYKLFVENENGKLEELCDMPNGMNEDIEEWIGICKENQRRKK